MNSLIYPRELNVLLCAIVILRVMLFYRSNKNSRMVNILIWALAVACAFQIYCLLANHEMLIVLSEAVINFSLCVYLFQSISK